MPKAKISPPRAFRLNGEHGLLALNADEQNDFERLDWRDEEREPSDVRVMQKRCRKWMESNFLLGIGLKVKQSFANHRMQVKAEGEVSKAARRQLKGWYQQNRTRIDTFVREAWEDYLMMDAAVAFWREEPQSGEIRKRKALPPPKLLTLPPEDCRYTDKLGMERLWVRLNLSSEDLKGKPERMQKRYSKGEVELLEAEGEYFRVLKQARVGKGFRAPRLYSLFRTLRTEESLEVFDALSGYLSRSVIRQTKVGHEIKSGPHAGKAFHFYTNAKGLNVKKFFEGRQGLMDWVGNFDIDFEYPFPSLDRFDKKKFEGVFQRISLWLGPVGMLLLGQAKGSEEAVMKMFRAEVEEDRARMRGYCAEVINAVFRPPVPVTIGWSDKLFLDSRLLNEALKNLLNQGALSQRTALAQVDEEAEEQREFKAEESDLAEDESTKGQVLPLFDPNHGNRPGQTAEGAAGRPAGRTSKARG